MRITSLAFTLLAITAASAVAQTPQKAPKDTQRPHTQIVPPVDKPIHAPYLIPDQPAVTVPSPNPYLQDGMLILPVQDPNVEHPNVRVELNLNRTPIQEALKRLFAQVKVEFKLESDVPADARITLRVKNVTFLTALNAITEEANIGWNADTSGTLNTHATRYHIGKGLRQGSNFTLPLLQNLPQNYWNDQPDTSNHNRYHLYWNTMPDMSGITNFTSSFTAPLNYSLDSSIQHNNTFVAPLTYHLAPGTLLTSPETLRTQPVQDGSSNLSNDAAGHDGIPVLKDIPLIGRLFTVHGKEERSVFTCPHCHQEITVIKRKQSGTTGEWKFCPLCGKEIMDASQKTRRQ